MDTLIGIILICGILFCSCGNADKNVSTVSEIDISKQKANDTFTLPEKPYRRSDEGVILEQADLFKISGDSTIRYDRIYSVRLKFEPYVSFDDYKVNSKYTGIISEIDYKSNKIARENKTVIAQTYKKEGVNFAGHYCFVVWPNGTSYEFAIVDAIDGKVYNIIGYEAVMGYEFKEDSRLIISNPPDSEGYYDANTAFWHPQLLVWDEINKKIIIKQPSIN